MSKERNFRFTVEVQMYTNANDSDEELAAILLEFGTNRCADVFDEIVNVESLPTKDVQRQVLINKAVEAVDDLRSFDTDEEYKWSLTKKTETGEEHEF